MKEGRRADHSGWPPLLLQWRGEREREGEKERERDGTKPQHPKHTGVVRHRHRSSGLIRSSVAHSPLPSPRTAVPRGRLKVSGRIGSLDKVQREKADWKTLLLPAVKFELAFFHSSCLNLWCVPPAFFLRGIVVSVGPTDGRLNLCFFSHPLQPS